MKPKYIVSLREFCLGCCVLLIIGMVIGALGIDLYGIITGAFVIDLPPTEGEMRDIEASLRATGTDCWMWFERRNPVDENTTHSVSLLGPCDYVRAECTKLGCIWRENVEECYCGYATDPVVVGYTRRYCGENISWWACWRKTNLYSLNQEQECYEACKRNGLGISYIVDEKCICESL